MNLKKVVLQGVGYRSRRDTHSHPHWVDVEMPDNSAIIILT